MRLKQHYRQANATPTASKFFHDLANSSMSDVADREFVASRPSANVIEFGTHYELQIAAPGVSKENISLETSNGILKISATKDKSEENKRKYLRRQFNYNAFSRSFKIGRLVNVDDIEASMENGVLSIVLPKKDATPEKRNITID